VELSDLNDNLLAQRYKRAEQYLKDMEKALKEHPEYVNAKLEIASITQILTQRLEASGASSIVTPSGTIHTVGKTTARVMDPERFQGFIIKGQHWDGLVWAASMTWCRDYIRAHKDEVPGVELTTFRRLSITAPRASLREGASNEQ